MPQGEQADKLLVFWVRRDTRCAECDCELSGGSMITLRRDKGALCLGCADMDHLEFLGRGDAALTRRAVKYSGLSAIVLQWSRARKRYERQGVMAEPDAIDRAEAECLADEPQRKARQQRQRLRNEAEDRQFVAQFLQHLCLRYPRCPSGEAGKIASHACLKYSGRVGRSAAAKSFDPQAIDLAAAAWVRHNKTGYDGLLMRGYERREARAEIRRDVERVLEEWMTAELGSSDKSD